MSQQTNDAQFFCEDCDEQLSHDDIEPAGPIAEVDPGEEETGGRFATLYECSGCGLAVGFALH